MRNIMRSTRFALLAFAIPGIAIAQAKPAKPAKPAAPADWTVVDAALGRSGTMMPGDVNRYAFGRGDLAVVSHGVTVKTSFALGGWLAFRMTSAQDAMMMGDLVLLESEVAPVIASLQANGVSQSALHNHMNGETPAVWYLHVMAHGNPAALARAARTALELTKTPLGTPAPAAASTVDLDTAAINRLIGVPGKVVGGVLQYSVPRVETIRSGGHEMPPAMGTATPINFQPTGDGKAAIIGDFVMLASEVNPVIKVLSEGGVMVTTIHSHWLDEQPHVIMAHFWANDDAVKLAKVLGAALDKTKSKRAPAK